MWIPVVLAVLSASAPLDAAQDTVLPVDHGMRLEVDNRRGEVSVTAWNRSAVEVMTGSSRSSVEVNRAGSVLRIRPGRSQGRPSEADMEIRVPAWMAVAIAGNQLDVSVRGTHGLISVETVNGDVSVEGGSGRVSLRTVQGMIEVRNARGQLEAVSVNDDITLQGIEGEIVAEATNGDITMRAIRSPSARANTVNGDLRYEGTIMDDGRYAFTTHNGDVVITVAEGANATVTVSTFRGEFESEFPVRMTGTTRDRRFDFTLGSGSARVELESFNGEIRLQRP